MQKYDVDDVCTFYFVLLRNGDSINIQGWSDNKDLAKAYMEFHKCKLFNLKSRTDTFDNMCKILEENTNDEISLYNLTVKAPPDHKKGRETRVISVPLTFTEMNLVKSENMDFLGSRVNYSLLNEAIYYLKNKYLKALKDIYLHDVINHVIMQQQNRFTNEVSMDELLVLFHSYPDHFGE